MAQKFNFLFKQNLNKNILILASWALTNIVSGNKEQIEKVISAGAVPKLVVLLDSPHKDCVEQSIWTLGNIAGDNAAYRDLIINSGVLRPLLKALQKYSDLSLIRNSSWMISNLCRHKTPQVDLGKIECVFPTLNRFICNNDDEVVLNACWAFSFLTDGPNERIERVIKHLDISRLEKLTKQENNQVLLPLMRILGNIASGSDLQTQLLIDFNILDNLVGFLKQYSSLRKVNLRKELFWTLSNIAAGNEAQKQVHLFI